jgi:hypothetical protein
MGHRHQRITGPPPEGGAGPRCRGNPVGVVLPHPRPRPLAVALAPRTGNRPPVRIGQPCKDRFAGAKADVPGPSTGDAGILPHDLGEVWYRQA